MKAEAGIAAGLLAALLLAGCASKPLQLYEGAPRPAAEVAVLTVPEAIEVVSVNGRAIEGARGLLRKGDVALEFAPGRYEVLAFYREIWPLADGHDTLRSDPAVFDVQAQAGGRYRLDYAHPAGYEAAQRLAADFGGWVVDEATGARTPSRESGLGFRKGLAGALGSSDALVPVAPRHGQTQAVAPLPAPPAPADAHLQQMQQWWEQATPEQREAFRRWIDQGQ